MKSGASPGRTPAKVSVNGLTAVIAGWVNDAEAVRQ